MSWKISGLVWELDLTHSQQSILLAMADHAEHDGSKVFPSVAYIAWKTSYSDRQIRRVMATLREMGILILVEEANRYRPREYRIDISAGKKKKPFRGDMVSSLGVEEDNTPISRADMGVTPEASDLTPESARADIAESARPDIAMSPRTIIKDQEPSFKDSDSLSQNPWVEVLAVIGSTYYSKRIHQRNSEWRMYWLKTSYGGEKDGKYIVLCDNEEQRSWLQDRGKKIAESKLVEVLGIKAEVKFIVEEK